VHVFALTCLWSAAGEGNVRQAGSHVHVNGTICSEDTEFTIGVPQLTTRHEFTWATCHSPLGVLAGGVNGNPAHLLCLGISCSCVDIFCYTERVTYVITVFGRDDRNGLFPPLIAGLFRVVIFGKAGECVSYVLVAQSTWLWLLVFLMARSSSATVIRFRLRDVASRSTFIKSRNDRHDRAVRLVQSPAGARYVQLPFGGNPRLFNLKYLTRERSQLQPHMDPDLFADGESFLPRGDVNMSMIMTDRILGRSAAEFIFAHNPSPGALGWLRHVAVNGGGHTCPSVPSHSARIQRA